MKILKFLLALLFTAGLIWILDTHNPFGSVVPAMGKILSPYQGLWKNTKVNTRSNYRNLKLTGLSSEVEVVYDDRLVPHIFANTEADAYFAQGYITAQHRLWQMDISTRAAAGRVSEVLGERTLEYDKLQRRRGIERATEKAVESWSASESYHLLEAYTAGVNAYIESLQAADYPIEFKLLGYAPEAWSIYKTALFQKSMALSLNFRHRDIPATNSFNLFGADVFNFLYPEYNPKQTPIIPPGTPWAGEMLDKTPTSNNPDSLTSVFGQLFDYPELPMSEKGIGSNNWVVAGSKTQSGNPILCNDPHLELTLPAIWFELQLSYPGTNVYGVSLPSLPGVIIGFNENIAWGVTNVGQDVTDWYNIKWANKNKTQYELDGKKVTVEEVQEEILVKGKKPVMESVKYTQWGPIVYEDDDSEYKDLAMRWLSNETPGKEEYSTFIRLNKAKSYKEYSEALKYYEIPAQNFVFASKSGDIAIKVNGKLPIKEDNKGRFILDGSTSKSDWEGYIPMEEVAQAKNPAQGFLASANQRSTDETYPYYYNREGFDHYRGRYINRALEGMNSFTVEDMMELQNSDESILAEEALPLLLQYLDRNKLTSIQTGWLKLLEDWDYHFDKDKIEPVLFVEWYDAFYDLLWDEIVSYPDTTVTLLEVQNWKTIEMLEKDTTHYFWDIQATAKVQETPTEVVTKAFASVWEEYKTTFTDESYDWQTHRGTSIAHLSRALEPFGRQEVPVNGYRQALNAVGRTAGPSWRMIVELGETIKAYGIYPGGQSGTPGSPFYENAIDKWAQGTYYELFFMKNATDNSKPILYRQKFKKQQ